MAVSEAVIINHGYNFGNIPKGGGEGSKSKVSDGKGPNILLLVERIYGFKCHQNFPKRGGSNKIKNFPNSKISQLEGGVRNFGNVSQIIPMINYDGFPNLVARLPPKLDMTIRAHNG